MKTRLGAIYLLFTISFPLCFCDDPLLEVGKDRDNFTARQYPETENLLPEYDFIIVGAGSAGCVLANRLSEISKWKILIIEAGGQEKRLYHIPATALRLQKTAIDWQFVTEPSTVSGLGLIDNSFAFPQGKVMGGSSTINAMIYTRGNPKDFDRWEKLVGSEWSYQEVLKYFQKLENYTVNDSNEFGHKGPVHIQESPFRTNFSNALLEAAQQYGLPLTNINAGKTQIGVSRMQSTTKGKYRFSSNSAYMVPISGSRPNLHLKMNCNVTKIIFDNREASGVRISCPGQDFEIAASKEVIVSAGALNSPKLLMLSGIGPIDHLTELGIPTLKDLPVGKNLMDHINAITQFEVNQTIANPNDIQSYIDEGNGPLTLPLGCEAYIFSQPKNGIQTIEQLFISSPVTPILANAMGMKPNIYQSVFEPHLQKPGFMVYSLLQKPKSRGYLQLRDINPLSPPKIFPNFLTHPEDVDTIVEGIEEVVKIASQPALQKWNATLLKEDISPCNRLEFKSNHYYRCLTRTITNTLYHYSGTCKMGRQDDRTSVVSPDLKVYGVKKLRVVDASIMPEIPTGHLNVMTMMIGEKAADLIKKQYGESITI